MAVAELRRREVTTAGVRPEVRSEEVRSSGGPDFLRWLGTTDHKRLGIVLVFSGFFYLVIGAVEALLMRIQLVVPEGDFISPDIYSQVFTLHGLTTVFLFMIPVLLGFATYLVPLMIGSRGMAFPRFAALPVWLFLGAGAVLYSSFYWGGPSTGFESLEPLSEVFHTSSGGPNGYAIGLGLVALAMLTFSVNMVVTVHRLRAPGMRLARLPVFVWTAKVCSYAMLLISPVALAFVTMSIADRKFDGTFFNPVEGGSALLAERLFWFFGQPAMFVMGLMALAMISEILPVFSGKPLMNRFAILAATLAAAVLGLLMWGYATPGAPTTDGVRIFFSVIALLVGIPLMIMILNWIGSLWGGVIEFATPMLFALGAVAMLLIGVLSGAMVALLPVAWQVDDSYFYTAHIHYVLMGGFGFAMLAGAFFWLPKMSGRRAPERPAKAAFWLAFIGLNVTFAVQFCLGLLGMPTRIFEYPGHPELVQVLNIVSGCGTIVLVLGIVIALGVLMHSAFRGHRAGPDPWRADTLEWLATSPPPPHNFDAIPVVRSARPMRDVRKRVADAGGGRSERRLFSGR